MRPVNLIVIHCSASPDGISLARFSPATGFVTGSAQVIDAWHAARDFNREPAAVRRYNPHLRHIGYHYVIDIDGRIETGRAVDEPGAHAAGFNGESIGICLVGTARYTRAQWLALQYLLIGAPVERAPEGLLSLFAIPLLSARRLPARGRLGVRMVDGLCGHRDLSPDANRNGVVESVEWLKTCPGFDVAAWLRSDLEPPAAHVLDPLLDPLPATGEAHA